MPLLQTLTFGSRFNQPLDKATWVDVEGVVAGTGSGNSRVGLMLASISSSTSPYYKKYDMLPKGAYYLRVACYVFCFLILTWILPLKSDIKNDGWKTPYFSFSGRIRQLFMGGTHAKDIQNNGTSHKMVPPPVIKWRF